VLPRHVAHAKHAHDPIDDTRGVAKRIGIDADVTATFLRDELAARVADCLTP
jgi:hypothetical protein